MDTLGIEPRASRALSGCDANTPCARWAQVTTRIYSTGNSEQLLCLAELLPWHPASELALRLLLPTRLLFRCFFLTRTGGMSGFLCQHRREMCQSFCPLWASLSLSLSNNRKCHRDICNHRKQKKTTQVQSKQKANNTQQIIQTNNSRTQLPEGPPPWANRTVKPSSYPNGRGQIDIYIYIYIYTSLSLSMYMYIHIYVYVYIYICIYIYIYVYTYIYIYISLSLYIYIYIYIHTWHFTRSCRPWCHPCSETTARIHEVVDPTQHVCPISLLRISLLRFVDADFPGKSLLTWEFHPLRLRFCLGQALRNPESNTEIGRDEGLVG